MKKLNLVCIASLAVAMHAAIAQEPAAVQTEPAAAPPPAEVAAPPAEQGVRVTDSSDADVLVSMSFDETPLTDVIKAFRDATGANIISTGGSNLQTRVSVRLDNVPWYKGLTSILEPQGLQLAEEPAGSGIFIVKTKTEIIPKITKTFNLKHARADEITDLIISAFGRDAAGKPLVSAVAYNAGNVVVVTGTEKQIFESEAMIEAVDKPTPQVYIEVRFVELTAGASKKLGLKWDDLGSDNGWGARFDGASFGYSDARSRDRNRGQATSADATATTVSSGGLTDRDTEFTANASRSFSDTRTRNRDHLFTGALSMDAFALTMNAFEQIDGVSIFSNPKIIVANEKEAVFDKTTKLPNVTMTSSRSGVQNDQLDISARLEVIPGDKGDKDGKGRGLFAGEVFFSWGISVKVTPRVSPTGLITLVVEPSISNLDYEHGPFYEFGGTPTPQLPIIDMQRMQTVFTMQDGSTAVIGGLTRTTESNIDSGIPLLRHLPWIGPRVFGWKSREKKQTEIIIFVTVGIADPVALPEDVGLPKNAILGRDLFTGELKEPGDRTKEEVLSIEDPKPKKSAKPAKPAATEEELRPVAVAPAEPLTGAAEAPAIEPLLKND